MKHQKLQFNSGSFDWPITPSCVLDVLPVIGGFDTGAREENHGGIQGYTLIQRVKTTGKTFYHKILFYYDDVQSCTKSRPL